MNSWWHCLRCK